MEREIGTFRFQLSSIWVGTDNHNARKLTPMNIFEDWPIKSLTDDGNIAKHLLKAHRC